MNGGNHLISTCSFEAPVLFFLKKTFNFEVIVNSYAAIRNTMERSRVSFLQFPSISCKTLVKYHNQDIDIGTIYPSYSDFLFTCGSHSHVYLVPGNVIMRRFVYSPAIVKLQFYHKDLLHNPLYHPSLPLP